MRLHGGWVAPLVHHWRSTRTSLARRRRGLNVTAASLLWAVTALFLCQGSWSQGAGTVFSYSGSTASNDSGTVFSYSDSTASSGSGAGSESGVSHVVQLGQRRRVLSEESEGGDSLLVGSDSTLPKSSKRLLSYSDSGSSNVARLSQTQRRVLSEGSQGGESLPAGSDSPSLTSPTRLLGLKQQLKLTPGLPRGTQTDQQETRGDLTHSRNEQVTDSGSTSPDLSGHLPPADTRRASVLSGSQSLQQSESMTTSALSESASGSTTSRRPKEPLLPSSQSPGTRAGSAGDADPRHSGARESNGNSGEGRAGNRDRANREGNVRESGLRGAEARDRALSEGDPQERDIPRLTALPMIEVREAPRGFPVTSPNVSDEGFKQFHVAGTPRLITMFSAECNEYFDWQVRAVRCHLSVSCDL